MHEQINKFIQNYLEKNNTKSAIMLTSPWGTGKSYYINNTLIKYLEGKCIIIPLYGLKDISEISKYIFLEYKFRNLNKKNISTSIFKIITKIIINGFSNSLGINYDLNDKEIEKIYSSIDLSNKLLIFEDVERTKIDILELLGFINSLVEDNVKVLLVTNEDEFKSNDAYLKIKEKTISDTIYYNFPIEDTIKSIVSSFNNEKLNYLINEDDMIDNIKEIMNKTNGNLRTFILACQKTIDILETSDKLNKNFMKKIFLGNIAFLLKNRDKTTKWNLDEEIASHSLGTYKFPLYKISYDYIINQILDKETLEKVNDNYCKLEKNNKKNKEIERYMQTIYNCYTSNEKELINAIKYVTEKILNKDIDVNNYIMLANYLIAIKYDLEIDKEVVDNCLKAMLSSDIEIENETLDLDNYSGIKLVDKKAIDEFIDFSKKLKKTIYSSVKANIIGFDYTIEKIDEFYEKVKINSDSFILKKGFAKYIDITKFAELIKKCNAFNIFTINKIFKTIYNLSNIRDFFYDDKSNLSELKEKIEKLKEEQGLDKVKKYQYKNFITYLDSTIKRLNM